jgi:hypothetical protein
MAEWYQGYSPDTTDKDAARLFEQKFGYLPLTLTRYNKSALLAGPIGKREPKTGDTSQRNGQGYVVVEVEKTLAGFTVLATGADGEPEVWEV